VNVQQQKEDFVINVVLRITLTKIVTKLSMLWLIASIAERRDILQEIAHPMKKVYIKREVLVFVVDLFDIFLETVRIDKDKGVRRQVVSKIQNYFDDYFLVYYFKIIMRSLAKPVKVKNPPQHQLQPKADTSVKK